MPPVELLDALPLVEQLADERARGEILSAFLGARLSDDDLRHAYRSPEPRIRRAGWRQLHARDAATAEELIQVAARDDDVVVRAIAAKALDRLAPDPRRRLAEILVRDRIGAVAVPGLNVLANLDDGDASIRAALTGRSAGLRRAARAWARIKGIDAREVYQTRLSENPFDVVALVALVALSELANPADEGLFVRMLDDGRSSVRAAGLRGLARVNPSAGRLTAVSVLSRTPGGHVGWAAASVLRDLALTEAELQVLTGIALADGVAPNQRLRTIALLRNARWHHLPM